MVKDEPSIFRPTSMRIENNNFENVGVSNDESAFIPEMEAVPGYSDSEHQIKIYSSHEHELDNYDNNFNGPNAVGFAKDLIILSEYIKENKEKAILYFLLSITTGLLLVLLICICQQCRNKKPKTRQENNTIRLQNQPKSPELNSLIGGSSHTSPSKYLPLFFM